MTLPPFQIFEWQQPASSAAKWKARGATCLYGHDTEGGKVTKAQWEAAVGAAGMNFITAPGDDIAAESKQPGRIGFCQPDEPDGTSHRDKPGNRFRDLAALYNAVRAASDLPVFANFQGSAFDIVAYDGRKHRTDINADRPYWHNAADGGYFAWADIIGFDYHLWTTGRPGAFDITKRLMDRLNDWSGGKPMFVYVETCTQGTGKPFTADDFSAQINTVVGYAQLKGYKLAGIAEFSQSVYPGWSSFDITSPEVVARMLIEHAKLIPPPAPPLPEPPAPDPIAARLDAQDAKIAELTQAVAEAMAVAAQGAKDAKDVRQRLAAVALAATPTPEP